jgi:glycerol-3-phosphate acyltransferase PlsY
VSEETWISLIVAYLLGSVPIGLLVVRLATGEDVRQKYSGRTGGTNVARTAGFWAGLVTALGDLLKGAAAVWLTRALAGAVPWAQAVAGVLAVVGHNYSIFLLERVNGRLRFRGGAGGATTVGAALALWTPSALIILPLALLLLFAVGYASIATISVGALAIGTFTWRALAGLGPWEYAAFGLAAEFLLLWSLRPNLRRLAEGKERLVGWRARWKARRARGEARNAGANGAPVEEA